MRERVQGMGRASFEELERKDSYSISDYRKTREGEGQKTVEGSVLKKSIFCLLTRITPASAKDGQLMEL